jgi:hypothetical protein
VVGLKAFGQLDNVATQPSPNRDLGHPRGQPGFPGVHLSRYEGLSMSGNEETKRGAEEQVSKELANQPKQDGPAKEESKDRRADAEEKLTK